MPCMCRLASAPACPLSSCFMGGAVRAPTKWLVAAGNRRLTKRNSSSLPPMPWAPTMASSNSDRRQFDSGSDATIGRFGVATLLRWDGGRNDVGLIVSMIDRVSVEQPIDRSRIYIVGFSRGGFMAHRMALEITDRLAGVAVVSPDVEPEAKKTPTRPLSFLLVSGDRDPVHPVSSDRPAATMERWRAIDHCPPLSTMDSESAGLTVEGARSVQRRHGDTLCHCPWCGPRLDGGS